MDKETFINEILLSINGITKVAPSVAIYDTIERRIQGRIVSMKTLWLVAASIVLLISINISLVISNKTANDDSATVLATSINKDNQLY